MPSGSEAGWLTGVVPMLSPLGSLISHQLRNLKVCPPAFKLMPSCFLCAWTSPGFTQDLLKGYIFLTLIWHFGLIWDQTISWKLVEMVFGTSPLEQGLFLWNSCFFSHQTFFSPLNSLFSFLLNLPETIPLKWSFLRIQGLKSKFLMLHGLKLNCEPHSNIFSQITPHSPRFGEEFNIVIQMYQPGWSDLQQLVYILFGEGQVQHSVKPLIRKVQRGL